MKEKKTVRRSTRKMNDEVKLMLAEKHDEEEQLKKVSSMASDSLFSINANKNDKKREKLRADRFKAHV